MRTSAEALLISTCTRIIAAPKLIPINLQQNWIHPAQHAGHFVLLIARPDSIDAADKHGSQAQELQIKNLKLMSECVRL